MYYKFSDESIEERRKRMQKIDEKYERQRKIISFFRYIFYSPLQIMFSIISLISRCLACILSLPLIYFIGRLIYLLYKGNGVLISDIINTLIFIGLPFLMFFIQELSDKISFYFRMNKY